MARNRTSCRVSCDRSLWPILLIRSTPLVTTSGSMICSASSIGSRIPISSPHVRTPSSNGGSGGAAGISELAAVRLMASSSCSPGSASSAVDGLLVVGLLAALVVRGLLHGTLAQLAVQVGASWPRIHDDLLYCLSLGWKCIRPLAGILRRLGVGERCLLCSRPRPFCISHEVSLSPAVGGGNFSFSQQLWL